MFKRWFLRFFIFLCNLFISTFFISFIGKIEFEISDILHKKDISVFISIFLALFT